MNAIGSIVCLSLVTLSACNGAVAGGPSDASVSNEVGADAQPLADAGACTSGSITFAFRADNSAAYCIGAPGACTDDWLTIFDARGDTLAIDRPCVADCGDCRPYGCPASCAMPQRMNATGMTRSWDGTYYASMTCGANDACVTRACAAAGHYTARMCAYRDLGGTGSSGMCSPTQTPTCTDVSFDWLPVGSVDGNLGAGECCPASWLMYACTYADGGSGSACHNPSLGCPSSVTCGEGCDGVVGGRCDGG